MSSGLHPSQRSRYSVPGRTTPPTGTRRADTCPDRLWKRFVVECKVLWDSGRKSLA